MKKLLIIIAILFSASFAFASDVKEADLAGTWYPDNANELSGLIQGYLDEANPDVIKGRAFAIISPHAGYRFSGSVAAYGFKAVNPEGIKTVILIGFSHRLPFDGISVYSKGSFRTPLGLIGIDEDLANRLESSSPRINIYPEAFKDENSIEMEVPFIQMVFKDALLVPIAFGGQAYKDAEILSDALFDALKDRKDYIIVASTDLSHYHPYDEANATDGRLIRILETMDSKELYDQAMIGSCELCGVMPVTAVLILAKKLGFDKISILKYANSGDTFGDKSRVVGYLSAVIYRDNVQRSAYSVQRKEEKEESRMLNNAERKRLLQIARESITGYVTGGKRKIFTEKDAVLNQNMGAFVTLHKNGELRGCIGNMVAQEPLYETVANMAIEAATGDPRFPRLTTDEIGKIDIEISVLSPMEKVSSYKDVVIPGHGVMIKKGFSSGVYLPQVADETGWSREEFLSSLCAHKAGLSADAWKDQDTQIYVFTAEVFGEKDRTFQ